MVCSSTVCSFSTVSSAHRCHASTPRIVRVLLGMSEERSDVEVTLREGPMRLISLLANSDMAHHIADCIVERANEGFCDFPIQVSEIEELFHYFLEAVFKTTEPYRIGSHNCYNFQRLCYNVAACTIAHFSTHSTAPRHVLVPTLHRATHLVAAFAGAVKHWFPASPWFGQAWTRWHALAYSLEMTCGTVLQEERRDHSFEFLVFCDTIAKHALCERGAITEYTASSFAWCACSRAWQSTLAQCDVRGVRDWTPHALAFVDIATSLFESPAESRPATPHAHSEEVGGKRARPEDVSPPVKSRFARVRKGAAVPRSLALD